MQVQLSEKKRLCSLVFVILMGLVMLGDFIRAFHVLTRMHSSRMHTAHSFTVCHTRPPPCMQPFPATHVPHHPHPLPHILPATHPPCHTCPPTSHACPPPHIQPSPAMHTPCHVYPMPCMPPVMHAPLPHTPPALHAPTPCKPPAMHIPSLWTEFLTHASENVTLPQLGCGR